VSSGLQLRLEKFLFGQEVPANGVIANIYALDPKKHKNSKRNVVIPVGSGSTFRSVEVEPGHYLVEAIMPSGDIISKEAEAVEGQWAKIELKGEHSAHEWHSWQNLLGNVQSSSGYFAATEKVSLPNYDVLLIDKPRLELQSGSARSRDVWRVLAAVSAQKGGNFPSLSLAPLQREHPIQTDAGTQLHSFNTNFHGDRTNLPRWYAVVVTPRTVRLSTVPCPWFTVEHEVNSELLVIRNADQSVGTSWVVQDTTLGTVLGYLANGALKVALDVANHQSALEMLFAKYQNPLGAAAGGYVLIGTMKAGEKSPWHDWIKNLRRDFKFLPDGAIQYAWLKLKQADVRKNRAEARNALFEAFDRGLPYYSLGLQWLLDGLTLLGEQDHEATERLKVVQRISWLADMSNLFTTLDLGR